MSFSDCHCHVDGFTTEELNNIVLPGMKARDVSLVCAVSVNFRSSEYTLKIAKENKNILPCVGIHPSEAVPLTDDVKKQLEALCAQEGVVGIGEVGFWFDDPSYSEEAYRIQRETIEYQIDLAKNLHLPINAHHDPETLKILQKMKGPGLTGLVHGLCGNVAWLNDWLECGFYVSAGGTLPLIWPPSTPPDPRIPVIDFEFVRAIPEDRILTETDANTAKSLAIWESVKKPHGSHPFIAPADVVAVAAKIAEIRGVTTTELGNLATENLKRLLKVE